MKHADPLAHVNDVARHPKVITVSYRREEVTASLLAVGRFQIVVGLPAKRVKIDIRGDRVGCLVAHRRGDLRPDSGRKHRNRLDLDGTSVPRGGVAATAVRQRARRATGAGNVPFDRVPPPLVCL